MRLRQIFDQLRENLCASAGSGGAAGDPNAPLIVTESRYNNFVEVAASESKFSVPAGYKLEKAPQFSAH